MENQTRIDLDSQHHVFYDEWYGYSVIKKYENAISQSFSSLADAKQAFHLQAIDWYYV